jgi:hypothetical protein
MILSRNSFFLFLFVLIILPLPLYKLVWLITTKETVGTMYFTGHGNLGWYQKNDPSDARINTFTCIWGDTLAYELGPFLIFLIILFHRDLVPKNAKVVLGKKPLIRFVKNYETTNNI